MDEAQIEKLKGKSKQCFATFWILVFVWIFFSFIDVNRPPNNTANLKISILKTLPILTMFANGVSRANAHGWTTFYKFTALSFLLHGAGDFLLGEDFFKIGLGAFLVAHLMNIKAFNANANAEVKEKLPFPGQQRYYLPFLVVLIIALAFLFAVARTDEETGENLGIADSIIMTIAVPIYGTVLASCLWRSYHRRDKCDAKTESADMWKRVMIGYCIYAVSDTLIAVDKFSTAVGEPQRTIIVMTSYWGGQWLITCAGDVEHPASNLFFGGLKIGASPEGGEAA